MHRVLSITLACWVLLAQGCTCRPELPDVSDDPPSEASETQDTAPLETADTGPEPPCAVPEEEPNNSEPDATLLPTEQAACGTFDASLDLDWWVLEFEEDGWLEVRVDAQDIGSTADVAVVLSGDDRIATREDNEEHNDVDLLIPATAGAYTLLITEETASSGERFFYDLLVTAQKEPFDVDLTDPGTNTSSGAAMVLSSGETVLGLLDDLVTGEDWYVIDVPPGRHALTIDVEGFAEGSPADTSVWLYDTSLDELPEGCRSNCEIPGGAQPGERDPYYVYDSEGNEAVYVRIRDASGHTGPAYWYVLTLWVEAS